MEGCPKWPTCDSSARLSDIAVCGSGSCQAWLREMDPLGSQRTDANAHIYLDPELWGMTGALCQKKAELLRAKPRWRTSCHGYIV